MNFAAYNEAPKLHPFRDIHFGWPLIRIRLFRLTARPAVLFQGGASTMQSDVYSQLMTRRTR